MWQVDIDYGTLLPECHCIAVNMERGRCIVGCPTGRKFVMY